MSTVPTPSASRPVSGNTITWTGYMKFLVVYLAGLSAFGSFVNDMYLPTLPAMTRSFGCSVSTAQLGLTMGMAGLGLGELFLGPLSDKFGRKLPLMCSLLLFVAASAVCIFSPNIQFFLVCRFLQGVGASGGYLLARTIPADIYGGRTLAKMMAVIGAINGFAPASAPVLGGLLAKDVGWQGIFIVLILFALLLVFFMKKLHESLPPERRINLPLLEMLGTYKVLLRNRSFLIHAMLKGSALGVLFAYVSSAPFIMQNHYGFSALHFGLFMGFNALFLAAGAALALKFKVLGQAATVGGWLLLVFTVAESVALWLGCGFWVYEVLLLPMLFSMGMIFTVGNTLAMNEGRAHGGDASALIGILGYIFGAIVAPLVGLGDILRSTAIVFVILAMIVFVVSRLSSRLPVDLTE